MLVNPHSTLMLFPVKLPSLDVYRTACLYSSFTSCCVIYPDLFIVVHLRELAPAYAFCGHDLPCSRTPRFKHCRSFILSPSISLPIKCNANMCYHLVGRCYALSNPRFGATRHPAGEQGYIPASTINSCSSRRSSFYLECQLALRILTAKLCHRRTLPASLANAAPFGCSEDLTWEYHRAYADTRQG